MPSNFCKAKTSSRRTSRVNSIQETAMLILGLAVIAVLGMFFYYGIDGVSIKDNVVQMTTTLFDFSQWFQKN